MLDCLVSDIPALWSVAEIEAGLRGADEIDASLLGFLDQNRCCTSCRWFHDMRRVSERGDAQCRHCGGRVGGWPILDMFVPESAYAHLLSWGSGPCCLGSAAQQVEQIERQSSGNHTIMQSERIVLQTENTTVVAVDQSSHGNACHLYEIRSASGDVLVTVTFQKGPIKEHGINGAQHVDLLAIVRDRLDGFQAGQFASTTNEVARGFVDAAMAADATRTRLRQRAGTEGTSAI